jgi:hypothetical protein
MLEKCEVLRCLMSLKFIFWIWTWIFFLKILVHWVRRKENVSTKTLRKWKEDTRVGGMLTWWVTAVGCFIAKFREPHIGGRATYAASPARERQYKANE